MDKPLFFWFALSGLPFCRPTVEGGLVYKRLYFGFLFPVCHFIDLLSNVAQFIRHFPSGLQLLALHFVDLLSKGLVDKAFSFWFALFCSSFCRHTVEDGRVDKAFSFRFAFSGSPFCRLIVEDGSVNKAFSFQFAFLVCHFVDPLSKVAQ